MRPSIVPNRSASAGLLVPIVTHFGRTVKGTLCGGHTNGIARAISTGLVPVARGILHYRRPARDRSPHRARLGGLLDCATNALRIRIVGRNTVYVLLCRAAPSFSEARKKAKKLLVTSRPSGYDQIRGEDGLLHGLRQDRLRLDGMMATVWPNPWSEEYRCEFSLPGPLSQRSRSLSSR